MFASKKFVLVVGCLLISSLKVNAEPLSFIVRDNAQTMYAWQRPNSFRRAIELNGEWNYQPAGDKKWYSTQVPSVCDYDGEITFRRTFVIDSSFVNHSFRLVCYGLNYEGAFYVNEKFIGSHVGGFSSFAFDIPQKLLKVGAMNKIEIRLSGALDLTNTLPTRRQFQAQKNFCGIHRDIYLLAFPEQSIDESRIDYHFDEEKQQATIRVICTVRDRTKERLMDNEKRPKVWVRADIFGNDTSKALTMASAALEDNANLINTVQMELKVKRPRLWHPDKPQLYRVNLLLFRGKKQVDQTSQWLGLKKLVIQNNDIYLNDKRLVLKGINYYETLTSNDQLPSATSLEQDVQFLKDLRANAVRVVGHIPHPRFVELCDRYGLLLLEELPLFGLPLPRMQSESFFARVADYATEMVTRDASHVSLFAWGIGGPYNVDYALFLGKLSTLIRQLDGHALYHTNTVQFPDDNIDRTDIAGLDLFGLDKDLFASVLPSWFNRHSDKLTMVTSFGSYLRSPERSDVNPTTLSELRGLEIVTAFKTLKHYQNLDGYFITSLTDWLSAYPRAQHGNQLDKHIVPSGLMGYDKNKRLAYTIVRSLYLEGKARINPGVVVKSEPPGIFPFVGVTLLLVFLFVYNTRKYFKDNLRRIFIHPHGFYVDLRDKRKIPISHTILVGMFSSIGVGLTVATLLYFFREHPIFDHLLTLLTITDRIKNYLIFLCWHPGWTVAILSTLIYFSFVVMGIGMKMLAILFRRRWTLSQSVTTMYWCGVNFMILTLLGMVLYRLLLYTDAILPVLVILAFFELWFLARLTKAVRVAFYWGAFRAFTMVVFLMCLMAAGLVYYFQHTQGVLDYLNYYLTYWIHLI